MAKLAHSAQPIMIDANTPPPVTRVQRVLAVAVSGAVAVIGVVATPFANVKLAVVPGFLTAFGSSMVVINVILATLLFSKGAIENRGDATRLGTAFLFEAFILVPVVAAFPGGIVTGSLIGTSVSSIWLWLFWHAGFGLLIIRYAWHAGRQARRRSSLAWSLVAVAVAVVAATMVSTTYLQYLPSTFDDGHTLFSGASRWLPRVVMIIDLGALCLVCRLRARTPEQLWLLVAMIASLFDVWLTTLGTDRYSLGWYLAKCCTIVTSLTVLLTLLHEVTLLHLRAAASNETLKGLAKTDGLTGLSNRRHFDELVDLAWRLGAREQRPLSVLMIDVDYFKNFNDRYGHPDGDNCLRRIAAMLRSVVRLPSDSVARYGGEEFIILLPATDAAGVAEIASRVQAGMRALSLEHGGSPFGVVTLSIGSATAIPSNASSTQELVAEADAGLYQAKTSGRDRYCRADGQSPPDSPPRGPVTAPVTVTVAVPAPVTVPVPVEAPRAVGVTVPTPVTVPIPAAATARAVAVAVLAPVTAPIPVEAPRAVAVPTAAALTVPIPAAAARVVAAPAPAIVPIPVEAPRAVAVPAPVIASIPVEASRAVAIPAALTASIPVEAPRAVAVPTAAALTVPIPAAAARAVAVPAPVTVPIPMAAARALAVAVQRPTHV